MIFEIEYSAICSPAFAGYDRVTRRIQLIKIDLKICFWIPWLVQLRQNKIGFNQKVEKIENPLININFYR